MTTQDILSRLNGVRKSGGGYIARCPAHEDKRQSLSISIGKGGRTLLKCHAGCSTEAIVEAMGLRAKDLFDTSPLAPKSKKRELVTEYIYPNNTKKQRYCMEDGSKTFCWMHQTASGWQKGRGSAPHCLYCASGGDESVIFVTEGEKDCDTLARLGYTAVTGENGAGPGKWLDEYTQKLTGQVVVILPDCDETGRAYAEECAAALHGVTQSVRVCDISTVWQEAPAHSDISDMTEALGPKEAEKRLWQLVNNAKKWEPKSPTSIFDSFGFYSIPDLTEEERRPPEFIVDGMIPVGLTFLSGAPKLRKSFMALQIAIAVATGSTFLGRNTRQCDVVYLDLEGSKSRISQRVQNMSVAMPRNVFVSNQIKERLADSLVDKLRQLHREKLSIRLIIVDTYSRARGNVKSTANAYDSDVALLEPVQRMALEENLAILFIHHDKKGAGFMSDSFERLSGTMGISGSSDCVINLVSEGKRFDGKATMEYTPRDAKGGEISLVFDDRFGEWQQVIENTTKLRDEPICDWIIQNMPERGKAGEFFSYDDIFRFAYNYQTDGAGDKIRTQLEPYLSELYSHYGVGIQMGVRSNCKRGIRVINLL